MTSFHLFQVSVDITNWSTINKFINDFFQSMELSQLLTNPMGLLKDASSPSLIFITSRGLRTSHEEVFITATSSLLNYLAGVQGNEALSTVSLLIAAKQPVVRYTGLLDLLLRLSSSRHKLFAVDTAVDFNGSKTSEELNGRLHDLVRSFGCR